jgi:hypothetical protein
MSASSRPKTGTPHSARLEGLRNAIGATDAFMDQELTAVERRQIVRLNATNSEERATLLIDALDREPDDLRTDLEDGLQQNGPPLARRAVCAKGCADAVLHLRPAGGSVHAGPGDLPLRSRRPAPTSPSIPRRSGGFAVAAA